jgi:Protein of unknown function (DUF1761)
LVGETFMVPVNYTAILIAALAAFIIGFLWHGPLFGKTWMRLTEHKMLTGEDMEKAKANMWKPLTWNFLSNLVMAFVLAHAYFFAQKSGFAPKGLIAGALVTAFWNWLGFIVCSSAAQVIWEGRKLALWGFTMTYWLVALSVMAIIIACF